ncbi:MAG: hypothetical protein Q9216_001575 [Gyalolechia sp. 2 TL-2023]
MSSTSIPHEQRTATEQRASDLHHVILNKIDQVNESIRLLRLQFRPGQWLDVHLPGIRQAGGFTITSTPQDAQYSDGQTGYLELAVQKSPNNPPAAWLWRPEKEILGAGIIVRVGGSFVWPPPNVDLGSITSLVFVAGGVGINPLMSIISHLHQKRPKDLLRIQFLYMTRFPESEDPSSILFLDRLRTLFHNSTYDGTFALFLTQCSETEMDDLVGRMGNGLIRPETVCGRISHMALLGAISPVEERKGTVAYVCGVPSMTDDFVAVLRGAEGMEESRVLCEKWW